MARGKVRAGSEVKEQNKIVQHEGAQWGGGYVFFKLLLTVKLKCSDQFQICPAFLQVNNFCEDPGSMGKILYSISFLTKNALKQTRSTMGSSRYSQSEKNEI